MRNDWCISMLHHRQNSVKVYPEIFNKALEGTLMIVNCQVVILWHSDPCTRSNQKIFRFVTVQLEPLTSHPSLNCIHTLLNVNNQRMKVRWSWRLVKLVTISKLLVTAPTLKAWYRIKCVGSNAEHDHVYELWVRVLKRSFETFSIRRSEQPERGELR